MRYYSQSLVGLAILALSATSADAQGDCLGDCTDNGSVTIDELILGINIALGFQPPDACSAFDNNADGSVTIDELIRAINNALIGCELQPPATATAEQTVSATEATPPTPTETVADNTPTARPTTPAAPTRTNTATATVAPPTPTFTPQSTSTATRSHSPTATDPPTPTPTAEEPPYSVIDIGGFSVVKAGGTGAVTFSTGGPDVRSVVLTICLDNVFTLTVCQPAVENVTVGAVQPGDACGVAGISYSVTASGDIPSSGAFVECSFDVAADAAGGDYPIDVDATLRDAKGGELAIGSDMALIPVGASLLVFDDLSAGGGDTLVTVENGFAFQIDTFCFYSAVDARCGGSGSACRRDQDCGGGLTCEVVACSVTTFNVHFVAFEAVTWPLAAGLEGRVPPAPATPFIGQLVCVEVDASGAPSSADSLSGSVAPMTSPRRFRSILGNQDGDATLTFGGEGSEAEYAGCPAPDVVSTDVLTECWNQSGYTFVCAAP